MDARLLEFTRQALAAGIPRPDIDTALTSAGWARADVDAALGNFAEVSFPLPVPRPRPYLSARDAFVYLILFAALYSSAYHLGSLVFDFINRVFPDPLTGTTLVRYSDDAIRWNISALLVSFSLFLLMFRIETRAIGRDPSRRNSLPRKWLTYVTLFVGAVSLAGDFMVLVYNALGGELTIRFVLKVATVGIIAGGTFAYFLVDIQQDEDT
jgi:hypothetical protein